MTASPFIFDRALVRQHRARALPGFAAHDVLFRDTGEQIIERVADVKRGFARALDLSPFPFLAAARKGETVNAYDDPTFDEEALPFTPGSFDLIVSNLGLQWVNDLPGCLLQIRAALKPEGMFVASLFGENSLRELRDCLTEAELSVCGGLSPRLSPTDDLQTASALLHRAGFSLPVADKETVTLTYPDFFTLLHDLRGMGQANAHVDRLRVPTRRAVFFEAARLYHERYADARGRLPLSFDIVYLHGWA
jgi:SAM-dependent methyltransferase